MKTGIELIAEERQRQMSEEGWTEEHDDGHTSGEMVDAAISYALYDPSDIGSPRDIRTVVWPWASSWWKPSSTNRVRNLVKAGALIAAEIDRIQRHEKK